MDKEQRRFRRIFLSYDGNQKRLAGVHAHLATGQVADILDLSYSGCALLGPRDQLIEKGQTLELKFSFPNNKLVPMKCQVVRSDNRVYGIQFENLSADARLALDHFMDDNLLGQNILFVNPRSYNRPLDFSHWLHGPRDTNIFMWISGGELSKAIIELDSKILIWNHGVLSQGESRNELRSAIEDYYSPVLFESARASKQSEPIFLIRIITILSQVNAPNSQIEKLNKELQKLVKA